MTHPRRGFLILILLVVVSLLAVLVPAWLIQPFRPQTPSHLAVSFVLRKWSPLGTLILGVFALFWVVRLWSSSRGILRRSLLVLFGLLAALAAGLSRFNHFEAMFNPLPAPSFASASQADYLPDSDRVLGIEIRGEAAAYPIRQLAYHHLVNDHLGGEAVVATY